MIIKSNHKRKDERKVRKILKEQRERKEEEPPPLHPCTLCLLGTIPFTWTDPLIKNFQDEARNIKVLRRHMGL
jgi:hypothetical protein